MIFAYRAWKPIQTTLLRPAILYYSPIILYSIVVYCSIVVKCMYCTYLINGTKVCKGQRPSSCGIGEVLEKEKKCCKGRVVYGMGRDGMGRYGKGWYGMELDGMEKDGMIE